VIGYACLAGFCFLRIDLADNPPRIEPRITPGQLANQYWISRALIGSFGVGGTCGRMNQPPRKNVNANIKQKETMADIFCITVLR